MKTENFGYFYRRMFFHPSKAFTELMSHDRKLKYAAFAALIPALGYTLFYIMAWNAGGSPSTFKPWLMIPIEKYFYYDIFLALPATFLSLISAAGIIHLVSKWMGSKASWDHSFVALSFGAGVAIWSTMLHDLIDAFLGCTGIISMREYENALNTPTFWRGLLLTLFAIYFLWFLLMFTIGLSKAHNLKWYKAFLLAVPALALYQIVYLIFIR
jgi:hypothetical protein